MMKVAMAYETKHDHGIVSVWAGMFGGMNTCVMTVAAAFGSSAVLTLRF